MKFTILHGTERFFTVFAISPLMVFVLSQLSPLHTFRYYFLKIYFNIILQFVFQLQIFKANINVYNFNAQWLL